MTSGVGGDGDGGADSACSGSSFTRVDCGGGGGASITMTVVLWITFSACLKREREAPWLRGKHDACEI